VPQCGKGRGGDQGRLTRERDPEAFEPDQEKENSVAVGGNEPRYSPLHGANLQGGGLGCLVATAGSLAASGSRKSKRTPELPLRASLALHERFLILAGDHCPRTAGRPKFSE
jgi:hypothetical protein